MCVIHIHTRTHSFIIMASCDMMHGSLRTIRCMAYDASRAACDRTRRDAVASGSPLRASRPTSRPPRQLHPPQRMMLAHTGPFDSGSHFRHRCLIFDPYTSSLFILSRRSFQWSFDSRKSSYWPRAEQCLVLGCRFGGATRHRVVILVVNAQVPFGRYGNSMAGGRLFRGPCYSARGLISQRPRSHSCNPYWYSLSLSLYTYTYVYIHMCVYIYIYIYTWYIYIYTHI